MILVRIGTETINVGLVRQFKEAPGREGEPPGGSRIEVVFVDGSTVAIEGEDAERLRRFLRANSTSLDAEGGEGEFSADDAALLAQANRGKHGA